MADDKPLADALMAELQEVVQRHNTAWRAAGVSPSSAGANLITAGINICASMIAMVARIDARGPTGFIQAVHPHIVKQVIEHTLAYAGEPAIVEIRAIGEQAETVQ